MADRVRICEVSPRDGLQNERVPIATDDKVRLIDLLSRCGFDYIEAASFVSPRAVPQMADGMEVMSRIARKPGVTYAALVPNLRGYEAALAAGVNEVAVFASASETFSQRNINCTIAESLARYRDVCARAARDGMPVRGYVSCVIACPYEGAVAPEDVNAVASALFDLGCREVSIGDTIGAGTADSTARLLEVLLKVQDTRKLAGHFHDTRGQALACVKVSLQHGLRVFDSAAGGAGGCPFAPGAPGNLSTESLVSFLSDEGYETGTDMTALREASAFLNSLLRHAA